LSYKGEKAGAPRLQIPVERLDWPPFEPAARLSVERGEGLEPPTAGVKVRSSTG
jgi:hypothetical protein